MPNIKSQKKRDRQNKMRTLRNRALKSKIKQTYKQFLQSVEAKDAQEAEKNMSLLYKALDKAAKRNLIHANFVANRKSGAAKKLSAIQS